MTQTPDRMRLTDPPVPVRVQPVYPNRLERVLKSIREVALILWLLVSTVLMVLVLSGLAQFANRVSDATTPAPAPTCLDDETFC